MPSPAASASLDQSRYQVRLEWGAAGLERLATADIVVVVDVLRFSSAVSARVAAGEPVRFEREESSDAESGEVVAAAAAAGGSVVLLGCLRNAAAVADEVMAEQTRRGGRTSIAVIAAGEPAGRGEPAGAAQLRFATEDLLGSGAIVDALSQRGIDHTSPEAATACEAFRGLRGAVKHLLSATGSGQLLLADERRDEVLAAAEINADGTVPVLRDGSFSAA